ncbi:MAG: hypothetical protein SVO96_00135 [Pseudomonadota bacterium]|nr:hypothetical protein [Pseudomonadota bacterium]
MQGKRIVGTAGIQEQVCTTAPQSAGGLVVVSLLQQLGERWSEAQRIAHLRDLVMAKAYRPDAQRMAAKFMNRQLRETT